MAGQREAILLLNVSLEVDLILFANEIVHGARYFDVLYVRPCVSRKGNWLREYRRIYSDELSENTIEQRERERERER